MGRADDGKWHENLVIRVMREEDLDSVIEIDALYLGTKRPDYYRMGFEPIKKGEGINLSLVAEWEGKVIGFIVGAIIHGEFGIPERRANIESIGIHPDYTRRGAAVKLMEQFLANAKAFNAEMIQTLVSWDNLDTLAFFKKVGFKPASRVPLERKL